MRPQGLLTVTQTLTQVRLMSCSRFIVLFFSFVLIRSLKTQLAAAV